MMPAPALTLYYDGRFPFRVRSMARLRSWNGAAEAAGPFIK